MKSALCFGICFASLGLVNFVAAQEGEFERRLVADTPIERIEALLELIDQPKQLESATVRECVFHLLIDSNELVRVASSTLVEEVSQPFLKDLDEWLKSPSDEKYVLAATAVKTLGHSAASALPLLKRGLESETYEMKLSTLWALDSIGAGSEIYLEQLSKIIKREYPPGPEFNLQCGALGVLGALGPLARPELETVLHASQEGQLSVRTFALRALGAIAPEPDPAVLEVFETHLNSQVHADRERALQGLANWGPPAKSLLPKIRDLMLDGEKNVIPFAAFAYYKVSGETDMPLKVLTAVLSNPTYEIDSIDMLAKMGSDANSLLPKIVAKLDSEDETVREATVVALQTLGTNDPQVIKKLQDIADTDDDILVRHFAKRTIKKLKANGGK